MHARPSDPSISSVFESRLCMLPRCGSPISIVSTTSRAGDVCAPSVCSAISRVLQCIFLVAFSHRLTRGGGGQTAWPLHEHRCGAMFDAWYTTHVPTAECTLFFSSPFKARVWGMENQGNSPDLPRRSKKEIIVTQVPADR